MILLAAAALAFAVACSVTVESGFEPHESHHGIESLPTAAPTETPAV
jgi:hypothetical protein